MTTPSFDIKQYFKTNAELIEKVLDQYLLPETEAPQTLHTAMRYAIMNGGKRSARFSPLPLRKCWEAI